jgi:3-dehydroquinate dehydratase-1
MLQASKSRFIAGLVSPDVLQESLAIKKCDILEIRYDLFENTSEWAALAQKVSELNPKALRLGTIRLERDGGAWKNERATERAALLKGKDLDWIDIERGISTKNYDKKIIHSWHLFDRVPNEQELNEFAEECLDLKVQGCKVAAMAKSKNDAEPLYDFAKKYGKYFELFSAFAMGEEGKESRTRSLKEGANLTYASIGKALAPGQLSVDEIYYLITRWI